MERRRRLIMKKRRETEHWITSVKERVTTIYQYSVVYFVHHVPTYERALTYTGLWHVS
jgi:hypothetical protein